MIRTFWHSKRFKITLKQWLVCLVMVLSVNPPRTYIQMPSMAGTGNGVSPEWLYPGNWTQPSTLRLSSLCLIADTLGTCNTCVQFALEWTWFFLEEWYFLSRWWPSWLCVWKALDGLLNHCWALSYERLWCPMGKCPTQTPRSYVMGKFAESVNFSITLTKIAHWMSTTPEEGTPQPGNCIRKKRHTYYSRIQRLDHVVLPRFQWQDPVCILALTVIWWWLRQSEQYHQAKYHNGKSSPFGLPKPPKILGTIWSCAPFISVHHLQNLVKAESKRTNLVDTCNRSSCPFP